MIKKSVRDREREIKKRRRRKRKRKARKNVRLNREKKHQSSFCYDFCSDLLFIFISPHLISSSSLHLLYFILFYFDHRICRPGSVVGPQQQYLMSIGK